MIQKPVFTSPAEAAIFLAGLIQDRAEAGAVTDWVLHAAKEEVRALEAEADGSAKASHLLQAVSDRIEANVSTDALAEDCARQLIAMLSADQDGQRAA